MGQRTAVKSFAGLLLVLALAVAPASARSKGTEQKAKLVDSGTFTIQIAGRKVGTETFTIKQLPDVNIAASEIKIEDNTGKARQSCELRLTSKGELQHYEWHELSPGKGEIVVEPKDDFIVEHISGDKDKKFEQPFLLPPTTPILDDFFFSQREILLWRYLASICRPVNGVNRCSSQKTQFGVIIPRQHLSSVVVMEYIGRESVPIHGAEQDLSHFRISSEDFDPWDLWVDSNQKLVRILIPSTNTEVVRE